MPPPDPFDSNGWQTPAVRLIKTACLLLGKPGPGLRDIFSRVLGKVWYRIDRRHRGVALDNLTRAYGGEKTASEIATMARRVFQNIARIPFEIGWALELSPEDHVNHFHVCGRGHLEDAQRQNRGVLILTAHLGNWELLSVAMEMIGLPHCAIARPLDVGFLDQFITGFRTRFGGELIPKERSGYRIVRRLRQGWLVAVLFDQGADWYEGPFVDFFGHRACTSRGLARLAARSGAPVVPLFVVRHGGGFRILIEPAVPLEDSGDKTRDSEENTQRFNQVIENVVRRYPEQWFWVHRRWKVRPYCPWPQR